MRRPIAQTEPPSVLPRRLVVLAGAVLGLAALAAYGNSGSGPFIYDDVPAIPDNPTIRHLGRILEVLNPPPEITSGGRPVVNLSLAVNYALGGTGVAGYHAVNLLIHGLAGLALFGIVRRTLETPVLRERFGGAALPLGFATALLWTLHPLQTEAVTYLVQRAESLMGLFYLLTLYCFVRAAGAPGTSARSGWMILSVLACLLGMGSKEVMVSAPLMVVLYDRTFVAGTFRGAWRRRRGYYLWLGATWLLLGVLVARAGGNRGGAAGFNVGVSPWAYWLTQFGAVVHYLRLSVWPHPLVFEYGTLWVGRVGEVAPQACLVLLLLAGTGVALRRRPELGFLGAWFFVMLAPTSLVPGTTQMIVEHRMYLSLAAVVALLVCGLYAFGGRRSLLVVPVLAVGLGWMTARRNEDYRSGLAIWRDTAAKRPGNATAHNNLGAAWMDLPGHIPEAMAEFKKAIRIKPDYLEAHNNLGAALAKVPDRLSEAMAEYQTALRIDPNYAEAHDNLGAALAKIPERMTEAMDEYREALRLNPNYPEAHNNLGTILAAIPGRLPEAIDHYESALRLNPEYADAHYNLGSALSSIPGRLPDAIGEYRAALRIRPDYAEAHYNLGIALAGFPERQMEAIAEFQAALRSRPDYPEAWNNLGNALVRIPGRSRDGIAAYEASLRLRPDDAVVHFNLGYALSNLPERRPEAVAHFQAALRLRPDLEPARTMLGRLHATP